MKSLARAVDRDELLRRLATLGPDSGRRWGRMSVHQMVCHLGDALGMALGRRAVTPASNVLQRTVVKWIALYAPLSWPAGIPTSREIDQQLGECTAPVRFDADVHRVVMLLAEMATLDPAFAWPHHPVFGPLTSSDWLRWAYLHTDHHLRQFGA